jgi:predicted RNA-binding Zn ribbon-like protein
MRPAAEVEFVGGHVALDFLNTAEARDEDEPGEALRTPDDLRVWGQRQGLLASDSRATRSDSRELRTAVAAREVLYRVVAARVRGELPADGELAELSRLVAAAHDTGILMAEADGRLGWRWPSEELTSVRHSVVHAAAELLARAPAGRLKECPGERCGWLFIDTTKRGNRRWCSMRECGTEAKLSRRRMRQTAADG